MGSLSVSTHRGLVHWQGLLLVVSLLTFWCLPTNAQFATEPTNVAEGKNVRLTLPINPQNAIGYRWFRGEWEIPYNLIAGYFPLKRKSEKGQFYENRMILKLDGTLLIKKASLRDRGMYTVVIYLPNEVKRIGFRRLDVYQPVKVPLLLASRSKFPQNTGTVVLTCYTNAVSIDWLLDGMYLQLSERMKLSQNRRTLIIDPVQIDDSGYYQCKASNPISSAESWYLALNVHE